MNWPVAQLTLRLLLNQKRTVLLAVLALVPVLLAAVFRWGSFEEHPADWASNRLMAQIIVAALLPLAALIFGTAALGSEIDDGTAVYLLAKPIPRWRVVVSKLVVAWLVTVAFVLMATVVAGVLALAGEGHALVVVGFAVAVIAGALAYCTVFLALSVATSRAFLAGLVYVFIWEGLVTGLFEGTRVLSIREYTLGLAGWIASLSPKTFEPELAGGQSLVLLAIVCLVAGWVGVRLLQRFETGESS
ncbi:MAG: ABC transporter permease [Dehalococcoidia bacterium]|nr:ABC transporter permease [Dehalococcoidia bacterium]